MVSNKQKWMILIEKAKVHELSGNNQMCLQSIEKAVQEAGHEWKVHFERVSMLIRLNLISQAEQACLEALEVHPLTGRLWAQLVQLRREYKKEYKEAYKTFVYALN